MKLYLLDHGFIQKWVMCGLLRMFEIMPYDNVAISDNKCERSENL